jgi:hypothetical protein
MSTDVPGTIGAVAAFLETDLLPDVAADRRSELRAAIKLLRDCADEAAEGLGPLQAAEHAEAVRSATTIAALQERLRTAADADGGTDEATLRAVYEDLGRHAGRRLRWQSVFPVPTTSEGRDA